MTIVWWEEGVREIQCSHERDRECGRGARDRRERSEWAKKRRTARRKTRTPKIETPKIRSPKIAIPVACVFRFRLGNARFLSLCLLEESPYSEWFFALILHSLSSPQAPRHTRSLDRSVVSELDIYLDRPLTNSLIDPINLTISSSTLSSI